MKMNKQGKITPSRFADVMTQGRGKNEKWGKTAITYAYQVALERLGVELPEVFAYALNWGIENEMGAVEAYEKKTGRFIIPCDTIQHPDLYFVAGTPDGLIGEDGIVEIKCPYNPVNHLANFKTGEQIEQYKYQIQGYLWITGRKWCDFVSFDPRFPAELQLSVHRVERDEVLIAELSQRVIEFNELVKEVMI